MSAINISRMLEILEQRNANDDDYLFSIVPTGFFDSDEPSECACVALTEMEVLSTRITPNIYAPKHKNVNIVAVVEAFRDFDYYKCITVGEFKNFLNNIKDKTKIICVIAPADIQKGWCNAVINADRTLDNSKLYNSKTRKLTGNNIFHLWI